MAVHFQFRCKSEDSREELRKLAKLEAAKRDMTTEEIIKYSLEKLQEVEG